MKTIFITAYHGFISRNIFNTDVLMILNQQPDLRVVLFVPFDKKEFISKYYGGENITVEGVDFGAEVSLNKFWYRFGFVLENTRYVRDQRRGYLWDNKNFINYVNFWWLSFWAFSLSRFSPIKRLYRTFDYLFSPKNVFTKFFEKYNPSLVFATDVFGETDVFLIREARHRQVPVVGMVRSWDNTTTKGVLRILPEKIIVNSPIIKKELIGIHKYKSDDIFVAGLPQFDAWLSGPTETREQFFTKIGADINKRLILFAPAGSILSDTDWQLCEILKESLDNGTLPGNIQFLVRNHPQHPADLSKFSENPNFILETPGSGMKPGDYKSANLNPEENNHLRNSIYYSDVVMYVATSLGLDSSIFNKPQILISFDGWESKPYIRSVRRYNVEDCLANLAKCGGTRVVGNKEELIKAINDYLKNPTLDQEGRNKAIEDHLYKIDGKAGERIANFLINFLNHAPSS